MLSKWLVLFLLSAFLPGFLAEKERFDNHKVYEIRIDTADQLQLFRNLENDSDGLLLWNYPVLGHSVSVMVAPHRFKEFLELSYAVRSLIDAESPTTGPKEFGWTAYNNYTEIYKWLDDLLVEYSGILTDYTVGTTFQGREIRAVKLSHKEGNPSIFIEANIHAREWITSATATCFLNNLLTSTDPDIVDLAQNIDWYIVPVFNVDGFHYTHTTNRLWRKTRQPHAHLCYGTDANRNFGFHWMEGGASQNPCSETYAGPSPFSEPETVALSNFVGALAQEIDIYLAFHSYGHYILYPYGHTIEPADNVEDLDAIGQKAAEGFALRYNSTYRVDIGSGTSVDYMYAEHGIRLSYTFEFRDRGTYGFILPPEQIIPNCEEATDAIIAMVAAALPPNKLYEFDGILRKFKISNELKVENLQTLIDAEALSIQPRVVDWTGYHNYTTIYAWLDELLETYPHILTPHIIGISYQGRPIRAVKLSHKIGNPTIFLESNIHAREWITSATATLIDAEALSIQPRVVDWTGYHNYTTIYAWLDELLETYPHILTPHIIGISYQGRPIRAVKLSHKIGNPTIFLESNIHAREWITSATATWFLNELLTSTDPDIVDLAENIDWYIIPIFNVDGFHFSHAVNRLWRKTRQNHATICFGTDANRNFDFHWMVNEGASQNPCSEVYAGPVPFSEHETAALRDFLAPIGRQINIYLSFHSYGQYILFPYGHTTEEVTETHDEMTTVGEATRDGFAKFANTTYIVGTTAQALYVASGTSVDWAYNEFNIPIGYTFEFRGGDSNGFILPVEQILPNCYETRDGIIEMVAKARELNLMNVRT
ncbi:Zinc carboxypeptidase, partial [Pseudolycoriella hygida]